MTDKPKVKIVAPLAGYGTRVWIDGREINGVQYVEFSHPVGEAPSVIIALVPANTVIETNAIPEITRKSIDVTAHDVPGGYRESVPA